mgnify:CR=1 FL=1
MMDALEELKKALDSYECMRPLCKGTRDKDDLAATFGYRAAKHLPALIAELEARRAQAGDIPNAAGFTPSATRAMR